MVIWQENKLNLPTSVVSIGAFDGLHRGHQQLITQAVDYANYLGISSVVYTFDPPPRSFFQGSIQLTTIEEKTKRIQDLGVDHVVIASFTKEYASRPARLFIDELSELNPAKIFVGPNFHFGKKKEGNVELLQKHFEVEIQSLLTCKKGEVISSTRIRKLIMNEKNQEARELLG